MYLVESNSQKRETEAIRHVVGSFHKEALLGAFGFDALTFIIIEAQKPKLTPDLVGDVDILAANLDFRNWEDYRTALAEVEKAHPNYNQVLKTQLAGKAVSEAGGLRWPPEPDFAVGIEVKCAYFTDRLKAPKSSPEKIAGIRKQIDWLGRMGFDRVGLLDVIANEPAYAEDGGFFGALQRSSHSLEVMSDILLKRLPQDSTAGHFVWPAGSVGGGDESIRGAGTIRMIRPPFKNPLLAGRDPEALKNRAELLRHIPRLLAHRPCPRYFPVAFVDCRSCGTLHEIDDEHCSAATAGA